MTKRQKNLLTTDMWPLLCMPVTTSSVAYRVAWELKFCSAKRNQKDKDIYCNLKILYADMVNVGSYSLIPDNKHGR